jgi:hypothetical protein
VKVKDTFTPTICFGLDRNPLSELADGNGNVIERAKLVIADAGHGQTGFTSMLSVFPNPASGEMNIEFLMEKAGEFRANIVNLQGVVVLKFSKPDCPPGLHKVTIDLSDLPNGAYMLKAVCGDQPQISKVVVNR